MLRKDQYDNISIPRSLFGVASLTDYDHSIGTSQREQLGRVDIRTVEIRASDIRACQIGTGKCTS